jgi:hypothetical protein
MKVILSEKQFKRIILKEQTQTDLISTAGYNAIEKMEDERGCVNTDLSPCENYGCNYDPHSKDGIIRNHINDTIGLETWFKIPDNFRVQIFDMMFNADSKPKDRYVWLGGLADALGFSGSRGDIMGDATTRADAIKFIQGKSPTELGAAYNTYKNIVRDEQYRSIASYKAKGQCIYDINWKYRPCQVERYYNGDNSLCNDLLKTAKEKKTDTDHLISNNNLGKDPHDPTGFVYEVRIETQNQSIDLDSIKLTLSLNKQTLTYTTSDEGTLVYRLVLGVSESEKECVSCENIKANNETILIDEGTFTGKWGGKRKYELIALPK